jgi:hypothetical protein
VEEGGLYGSAIMLEVVMELRATVTGRALPEKELGLTPLGVDILA